VYFQDCPFSVLPALRGGVDQGVPGTLIANYRVALLSVLKKITIFSCPYIKFNYKLFNIVIEHKSAQKE